jgi:Erv1 / Alr family
MFICKSFYIIFIVMTSKKESGLNPDVWGPRYWFFLHTIAINYPNHPNAVTKKKYYDFIQNLPLFLPVESIASDFSRLLDEYPVSSYLDDRESFIRWTHFIHNKINEKLEKPKITLDQFYVLYYDIYKPVSLKKKEESQWKKKAVYGFTVISMLGVIYYSLRN